MAYYVIAGHEFPRKCTIALSVAERTALESGEHQIVRAVEWPVPSSTPNFEEAYVDQGGTDIWGPGPYLKVPNIQLRSEEASVNRVFCPWGYPPDFIRVSRKKRYVEIKKVELEEIEGEWSWRLTLLASKGPRDGT